MSKEELSILFYEMVSEAIGAESINESAEDIEECLAVYEVLEEVFVNNYREPTIDESVVAVVRGYDNNDLLIESIAEVMLDESIGSAIATAVHGIGQRIAAHKAKSAQSNLQHKIGVATKTAAKAGGAAMKAKKAKGQFASAFAQGRAQGARDKAKKAAAARTTAKAASDTATHNLAAKQQKRTDLAKKIDTKISNARSAIKSGVHKATSVVGRLVGRLAT